MMLEVRPSPAGRTHPHSEYHSLSRNKIIIYRLLVKIIDFYYPLFYYRLMTSAGYNVTYLSHGNPLNLNIFVDFSLEICGFFTIVYLVFQKTMKLCTTTFGEIINLTLAQVIWPDWPLQSKNYIIFLQSCCK